MAKIEVWVPLIGDGHGISYGPDIPNDIGWETDEAAPTDLTRDDGRPAVTAFNIIIDEKDRYRITEIEPPEKDVQLVNMIRACRGDYNGKAEAFFNSIPDLATADGQRKRIAKDVLLQAVARGLPPEKAQAIVERHGLPQVTSIGGIDERH